ncbi:XRE family transcriptional regulator [Asanoa ishikariensis]|uniref:Helix-turn-helix domain-containing protein n=1 Tax=Asanoa ishikariensis TaxID=137265 RepID=A0A1H3TP72_9ACTN|nr:helix-turn-helix transcriptional regulator [Asanoa ishikariensis]GIF62047.1 XRE family transcriptional regulator [Asanoa ishikariensis]SDZ52006.1 Helix-turn-helix domain-containing protein [Asanoa ishikariensis]
MDFPRALRERRTGRRLSQLDLALRAGTTQRHLSFIESGRSVAGRNMVVRLAESLELPLRERNELLLAAGYAPAYPENALDDPVLAPVRTAIDHILRGHLPYPALVVDRDGNLIAANDAFSVITEGAAAELLGPGRNMYRLALHPEGVAPRIRNLAEWARHILARLGHQEDLRAELAAYVPALEPADGHLGFAVPLHLGSAVGELHLMTTVTTFATAVDVTLAELKLEAFLPVDSATAEALHAANGQAPGNM